MLSINEVLKPQKFKSDFEVKRERDQEVQKTKNVKYRMKKLIDLKKSIGSRVTRNYYIDRDAVANPSPYQPPK